MKFDSQRIVYTKTILSELQNDWNRLRNAILNCKTITAATIENLIFHVDEAMSWKRVHYLSSMKEPLLIIKNIVAQSNAGESVRICLKNVEHTLQDTLNNIENGKKL